MIQFSPEIGLWSKFIFWYVVINALVSLVFVVVVTIGGISDVRYLLRAIREDPKDLTDDGRVREPSDSDLHEP
jgi:hypothetical protein